MSTGITTIRKKFRMRDAIWIFALAVSLLGAGCASRPAQERNVTRIAFGSCINTQAHPMLDRVLTLPFETFILLGDNIYADTTNKAVMAAKYRVRKESAFYRALRAKASIVATWDDHDF